MRIQVSITAASVCVVQVLPQVRLPHLKFLPVVHLVVLSRRVAHRKAVVLNLAVPTLVVLYQVAVQAVPTLAAPIAPHLLRQAALVHLARPQVTLVCTI